MHIDDIDKGDESIENKFFELWKVLIVDDEPDVHNSVKFALMDYGYLGKPLMFLSAYNTDQAKEMIKNNQDCAVVILDMTMERDDSGLEVVKYIREELKNSSVRVIILTGEVFGTTQEYIVLNYDINDYLSKDELTNKRLFSAITSSLRAYIQVEILQQANNELEVIIAERTKELNRHMEDKISDAMQKYAQAQKESDEKDLLIIERSKMASLGEMVGAFGHEMMTPVGIAVTASSALNDTNKELKELYESGKMKKSDFSRYLERLDEFSKIILSNLSRSSELIASLKSIAVDQSSDQRRLVNVKHYLDEIILSLKPRLKRLPHKINIKCPENIEVELYAGPFSQIVINLIMNSMIHGFDGVEKGLVEIGVQQVGNDLIYTHKDNGKGMSPEVMDHLYEQFFTTKKNQGGSGIGMNLIKKIVSQTLKGTIECESAPSKGVLFSIRFPIG